MDVYDWTEKQLEEKKIMNVYEINHERGTMHVVASTATKALDWFKEQYKADAKKFGSIHVIDADIPFAG